jgi:glycosyltransferase involved in cell wall biosynthesis
MTRNAPTPLVAVTGSMPLGGSSTFLVNLARAFHERDLILPVIVLAEENVYARDFAAFNGTVQTISRRAHIYEDRLMIAREEIAQWQPRGILACLGSESFEQLRLAPPGCARIGVIQSHDPGPYAMARQYAAWIDAMIGVSAEVCSHLKTIPEFNSHLIESIPYGIPFTKNPQRSPPSPDAPLRIIYLGRMIEEQKRVSRLIEVVKLLAQRQVKARFTFAGSGPQLNDLKSSLQSFGNVEFLGEVRYADVQPLLSQQDIFLLLSDFEGLPLSLLEAMGQGVVPVVSDLPSGIREAVTDDTGVRVPIGDSHAAVEAIASLARDRQRLKAMSDAASISVRRNFGADRMAGKYLDLVDRLAPRPVVWPRRTSSRVPLGVSPLLFAPPLRPLRRVFKRITNRLRY